METLIVDSGSFLNTFKLANVNGSVSKAAPGMAEVPGTSSETITETVETSTPPPPQQVYNDGGLVVNTFWTVLPAEHETA